ncbi:hypothetical protein GBAR_LOCUS14297 [Geodia barretti]|uniref:Uncharacterized protein n=1 Tax=Geodia barretti TaxID=519541 RepID=A0AA35S9V5_GEOBA|nr:hypothetical protein GBAR_LOCUS14297 [Geodia barretti]
MRLTLLALALATLLVASSAYPAKRERVHYPQPDMADGQAERAYYPYPEPARVQPALILGLQVAIAVLGNFRGDRLSQYVDCFERSIGYDSSTELPANITFPTFGRDKEVYVYFFISLVLYNFALCIYALKVHNIVEVYMFLVINLLAIGYAGVQGFLLIVFTVVFVVMSRFIYVEFGWKIYTRVGCNSDLRWYYRVYEVVMSGVKLLILFMLIFLLSQCILLLYVDENNINYEFWVVIFALVPFALAAFPLTRFIVRREHILGSIGLIVTDIAVIAYNAYKIFRYATRSCPLCQEQVSDVEDEVRYIEAQLSTNSSSSTVREIVDRIEQFEHLVLLGVVNLVIAVLVLLVFLYLLKQYRKGLKEYFVSQSSGKGGLCSCCSSRQGAYDIADGGRRPRGVFLNLRKVAHDWSEGRKPSVTRSSNLVPEFGMAEPDFRDAPPTTGDVGSSLSNRSRAAPVRKVTIQED